MTDDDQDDDGGGVFVSGPTKREQRKLSDDGSGYVKNSVLYNHRRKGFSR